MVGRGASLDGRLFLGGTDGSNPVPSSGESTSRAILPIYSFRAATVRNILDFPHDFSPPATVIALERNYRSTQPILDAANAVIARARARIAKTLCSTKASAERPFLANVEDEAAQAK
jgi:hypothetical protein